jgi:uncharacterized membrane protein YecN with MAPEG domain
MRVLGNFAEYVPLALAPLLIAEVGGANAWPLHGVRLLLITRRLVHAYGVSQDDENYRLRVVRMAMTFAAIIVAALLCLTTALVDLA